MLTSKASQMLAIDHLGREPTEAEARAIQFPILTKADPDTFEDHRFLAHVADDVVENAKQAQVFDRPEGAEPFLAVLADLSNHDKHRKIQPTYFRSSNVGIQVGDAEASSMSPGIRLTGLTDDRGTIRRLASASPPTSAVRQDTLDLMSASNALGGYLDTKNVLRRSGSGDGGEVANESGEASAKASQALELLAQAQFPTTMPTLLAESGWDVGDFAQAIDVLRKASLIDVTKDGDTETVQLTEQCKALRPS